LGYAANGRLLNAVEDLIDRGLEISLDLSLRFGLRIDLESIAQEGQLRVGFLSNGSEDCGHH
jgi:hypothetical protein